MHRKHLLVVVMMVAVLMLLAACAQQAATPQVVRETVVVTQEIEKVVTQVVEVTKEVEKVVEVTPVAGRCAPTDPDEVDKILIGATGPLSAPGSVVGGLVMQWSLNIAVKHINEAGGVLGKPVDLIFYDTEGLPERGTAVAERLITQDCVVGIVGEYHSAVGLTMMEVAHKYRVPVVFAETWNDKITGSQYDEIFRIAPASSMVAEADANYIQDLGAEFVVIVAENSDYGVPASEATKERLAQRGIDSEIFLAEIGTQDWSPIIARIQALDRTPDVVLTLVTGEASYNFEQQAAEAGLMPPRRRSASPTRWPSTPRSSGRTCPTATTASSAKSALCPRWPTR
ncbi:MAG: ABC transporter substrate-binding protein [Ardenticatenia bacterium]|nr:ABC transporter substrate-binding protein [Ardenticatenia bacterium]